MALGEHSIESDIHLIAYYYHWAREDILRLSSSKRKTYIELITAQVNAENGKDDDLP
jgi:hypothetical protein